MMRWSVKHKADRHPTGMSLAVLLIVHGLLLSGCSPGFFKMFAIRDYDPVIKLPSGSQVRVKTSRGSVKVVYRRKF